MVDITGAGLIPRPSAWGREYPAARTGP